MLWLSEHIIDVFVSFSYSLAMSTILPLLFINSNFELISQ